MVYEISQSHRGGFTMSECLFCGSPYCFYGECQVPDYDESDEEETNKLAGEDLK